MIRKAARSIAKRLGYRAETSRPCPPSPHASSEYQALGDRVFNKAGRMVLVGEFQGEKVKVYEAANPTHAEFIEWVSNESELRDIFPAIRCRRGALLYAEWVRGESFDLEAADVDTKILLEQLLELQLKIHQTTLPPGHEPVFDYWKDLILPRFERISNLLNVAGLEDRVLKETMPLSESARYTAQHPDMTLRNLILDRKGQLRVIDNDVLTIGKYPLLDVCNTVYALPKQHRQQFWDHYLVHTPMNLKMNTHTALQAFWLARKVGSLGVNGKLFEARRLIERYLSNEDILPMVAE